MMAENYYYIPENQIIENRVDKGLFGEVYFGEGEYLKDIKNRDKVPQWEDIMEKILAIGEKGSFLSYTQLGSGNEMV